MNSAPGGEKKLRDHDVGAVQVVPEMKTINHSESKWTRIIVGREEEIKYD